MHGHGRTFAPRRGAQSEVGVRESAGTVNA
jgi:hypothetical protein